MALDLGSIKEKIEEVAGKIKSDPSALSKFKTDPEGAVKDIAGVDIPDGALDKLVDGVKAALASDKLGEVSGKLKGLFK